MTLTTRFTRGVIVAMGAIAIAACSERSSNLPTAVAYDGGSANLEEPTTDYLSICKYGPAGSYQFTTTATPTGTAPFAYWNTQNTTVAPLGFDLATDLVDDGNTSPVCHYALVPTGAFGAGASLSVRIVETGSSNGATVQSAFELIGNTETPLTVTNNGVTVTYTGGIRLVKFNNGVTPPGGGGDGCTPGYWKQSQHFDSWTLPYTPSTPFNSVFAGGFSGTLLQALQQGGGGLKALQRHAVAALLDAASSGVDYDMSVQQVINGYNSAYASNNATTIENQKNTFAILNNQGCPLN